MKTINILTHKLGKNYGGMLQAFALKAVVESFGNNTVNTYHRQLHLSLYRRIRSSVATTLRNRGVVNISSEKIDSYIQSNTNRFVETHINYRADAAYHPCDLAIVGSDQVWRAAYVDPFKYMFGDLEDLSVRRISYAASFGTDNLSEYSQDQIDATAKYLGRFSGISVREESGVDIVKQYWQADAEFHVDPTLLLDGRDYSGLVDGSQTRDLEGELFVYVLDRSSDNANVITKIVKLSGLDEFELMPKEYRSYIDFLRNKRQYVMPKVEQWLRSFRDADFVVTDSFHGTVFSIIFNKPFIAIGNKKRGLARFTSLLSMFGLENRLVTSVGDVTEELINKEIDWVSVNAKIKSEQKRSLDYLKKHLG